MAKDEMITKGKRRSGGESLQAQEPQELFSFSPLQLHFLGRLKQLVDQRVSLKQDEVPPDDLLWRVSSRAMYSTYQDCVDIGVGEEANAILQGEAITLPSVSE
ncbi:MAG: hypothetical protein C1O27_000283 [Chloroflexi bacterium]|jgi:hypothetical protein|nr:MAG: hypothetical protein C1O27_000283 [Chloroflexota bacterium]